MRFKEITPPEVTEEIITEVPMNPGAYATSLSTAVEKGVKIGFEFEVCVPEDTIKNFKGEQKPEKAWWKDIYSGWWEDVDPPDMDDDVAKIIKPVEFAGKTFTGPLSELASAWAGSKVAAKVKTVFEEMPVQTRKMVIKYWNELRKTNEVPNDAYQFGCAMRRSINYTRFELRNKISNAVESYYGEGGKGFKNFWLTFFGTVDLNKIIHNPDFEFNQDSFKELLNYYGDDDDDDDYGYGNDYDYSGAVKVLKPMLEKAFTKVQVFNDYHESDKDTKSWYIEPDGSLNPKDGDGAAEVVTPPMPVATGIESLKTFFNIARQLKLYTGQEYHTGLHINVSIPNKLDILKLAVFVGDEHLLKNWNREDNEYASSVIKSLRYEIPDQTDDAPAGRPAFNLNKKSQYAELLRIAQNISDDHMATISQESGNKYVSFRHAGGDYLTKQESVLNVVGRFVRAMVIAADPTAYRKEYLAKLTKLITPEEKPQSTSTFSGMMSFKTKPFTVLLYGLYGTRGSVTPRKLINSGDYYGGMYAMFEQMVAPPEVAAVYLPKILSTISVHKDDDYDYDSEGFSESTMKKIKQFPNNRALVVVPLNPGPSSLRDVDIEDIGYYPRIGMQVRVKEVVQPGTPLHTMVFQQLFKEFKERLKAKKAGYR